MTKMLSITWSRMLQKKTKKLCKKYPWYKLHNAFMFGERTKHKPTTWLCCPVQLPLSMSVWRLHLTSAWICRIISLHIIVCKPFNDIIYTFENIFYTRFNLCSMEPKRTWKDQPCIGLFFSAITSDLFATDVSRLWFVSCQDTTMATVMQGE